MQVQNAFNDNVAKFVLLPFGVWLVAHGQGFRGIEHVLAGLLVLPYILFAPTCGWISDRFAKSRVIRFASWFQLAVLGLMVLALWQRQLWLAVFAFFLLAVQSSLLSPAKMGVVKELLGSKKLGFASGVMEAAVILAILAGQILGGIWFDLGLARTEAAGAADGWTSAVFTVFGLWAGGVISIILAHLIERTRAQSGEKFKWSLTVRHFRDARMVWRDHDLRASALGVAYFWGFAGFVNLVVLQMAKGMHDGGQGTGTAVSVMMTWASVGIAVGSLVAALKSRQGIDWGLVPIGAFVTAVGLFLLAAMPEGSLGQYAVLALAGAGAAVFLVPLNAHVQDHPPAERRGTVLAVVNLFCNLAGIAAVALQFVAASAGVAPAWQFLAVGFVTLGFGWMATWRHGADMVRSLGLPAIRWFYRTRVTGAERLPERGGVLLLANHVSFADAFLVTALCPRRLRFVMAADFERNWMVRWFTGMFDTVPISPGKSRQGIRRTADALRAGEVVCVFPEGQLTRTGMMNELRRGFELIARTAGAPVVPMYVDGMWGSYFSFGEGGFFKGWPRRPRFPVTGEFGEPIGGAEIDSERLNAALMRLAADCLAERVELGELCGAGLAGSEFSDDELRRFRANGYQVGGMGMLPRGRLVQAWRDDEEVRALVGLTTACPELFGIPFRWLEPGQEASEDSSVVGGRVARQRLAGRCGELWLFDFSAAGVSGGEGIFPCLAVDGIVVAVSMPDPPMPHDASSQQKGGREGSRGRLLAGFVPRMVDGGVLLEGPSCPPGGLRLPAGSRVDGERFVFVGDCGSESSA